MPKSSLHVTYCSDLPAAPKLTKADDTPLITFRINPADAATSGRGIAQTRDRALTIRMILSDSTI
jgi:hypothetical protein